MLSLFSLADIYYTKEYVKAFQIHGDGEPLLFYYSYKEMKALNVVMKRKINDRELECFDLATPYGYGGWIIEGNITEKNIVNLNKLYTEYCVSNNIVSEFVRFHPLLKNADNAKKIYDVVELGNTIHMDIQDAETIWKNITSKNRNVIRKAEKSGITIKMSNESKIFDTFIEIYNDTMDRDNANNYYYFEKEFYDSIRIDLMNNAVIYYAEMNEKIIGAAIILYYNNYVHYHLSGAIKEYMTYAPMNLLLYKVACDFCEKGYKKMHLGGGIGSDSNSGLYRFKESFNKNGLNRFCVGKKIFDKSVYDKLLNNALANNPSIDLTNGFFPAYRIGEIR